MIEKENQPLCTIAIQCYNHARYIRQAMDSALNQTYQSIELLVNDDGSQDESAEIIAAYGKQKGFVPTLNPNQGLMATLNAQLMVAQGKYICFLAGDDWYPQEKLEQQIRAMEAHPEWVVSVGKGLCVDDDDHPLADSDQVFLQAPKYPLTFKSFFLARQNIASVTMLFRTDYLQKLGGFPLHVQVEDYWFFLKATSQNQRIGFVPEFLGVYRVHEQNLHHRTLWMYQQIMSIVQEYQQHPLYPQSCRVWRANFFSEMAISHKVQALRMIPETFQCSRTFCLGLLKWMIPRWLWLKFRQR